jgi:hypothetical protein|tara:strand:- start:159 stop:362 length:204 start_codon:yes stop_codon:yes gene_type:complete
MDVWLAGLGDVLSALVPLGARGQATKEDPVLVHVVRPLRAMVEVEEGTNTTIVSVGIVRIARLEYQR